MTDEDVLILKKFYSVETDLELIEAQHHHIEKLQDEITSVKWTDVAVRGKPRFAVVAFALLLLSVGVAQADTSQRIGGDSVPDCSMWFDKDSGIQHEGRGCSLYLPKPGCYQKMREAMRLAEGELVNKPPYIPPKNIEERQQRYERGKQAIEQWEATYAECVK